MMHLPPIIQELDRRLQGLPDSTLTVLLLAISVFGIIVALKGRAVYKAALAAWFIAP